MEVAQEPSPKRRRFRRRHIFYGALLLFVALLAYVWIERTQIADSFVRDELAKRDVRASYRIARIGLETQRIEDVVLGDPRRPDLTADWVEIDIVPSGFGAKVARVRADGVRLYGRLTDRGLSFGEIDKFRDPTSKAPFSLPEIFATLSDARVRVATPYGDVGIKLVGQGQLADGFTGQIAAVTDSLQIGPCASGALDLLRHAGNRSGTSAYRGAAAQWRHRLRWFLACRDRTGARSDAVRYAQELDR